jgi:transcriptional regulator
MDWDMKAIRSYSEVAEIVGLTRQRVMQIEQLALRKLSRNKEVKRLAEELGIKRKGVTNDTASQVVEKGDKTPERMSESR